MTPTSDTTYGALLAHEINDDPAFRQEWQRLALARAFAAALIRYRSEHKLSQTKLARLLGISQPRVAVLESGERNPVPETIIKAVDQLQIEFAVDFAPAKTAPRLLTKTARAAGSTVTHGGVAVTVSTR
jgi:DNA-binding XRE family transcriptional regulator